MRPFWFGATSLAALLFLAGCGSGVGNSTTTTPVPTPTPTPTPTETNQCKSTVTGPAQRTPVANYSGAPFTGKVMAGALPVIGAAVQLYAAGATGNGSAATALLTTPLTTDSSGAFAVPSAYTCPYDSSVLYAVARGGRAGASGAANSGTVLMTPVGTCSAVSGNPGFVVDEATTVASAFAMDQFLSSGGNLGASSTNISGITLAAGTAANLVNTSTGVAPGAKFPAGTGTAPSGKVNSLANLLNACIVSSGASSTACAQLYSLASVSGSTPSNTLDAVANIAKNPGANVPALYTQSAAASAYTPALSTQPADWTMFVAYTGGGMNAPSAVGIDSGGNVWVANYFSVASLFSNTGTPLYPSGITGNFLYNSYGLAVDSTDTTWITNQQSSYGVNGGLGTLSLFNNSGASLTENATGAGGLNFPTAVAIDRSATTWVADYGNSHVTLLTSPSTPVSGSAGYGSTQFVFPVAIAVDSKCYGFVANQSSNTVTSLPPDGSTFTSFVVGSGPSAVAVDGSDNVWVGNYYNSTVGLVSSAGKVLSGAGYNGGGLTQPQGLAIDGNGSVWVANYRGPSITQLSSAASANPGAPISPATGWGPDAKLLEAFGIAIDASGNVWVSSFGSNTVTEFVGLAAPVKTPLLGPVRVP